ncbi:MAG: hypothetical protein M3O15_07415 [Acidobacteriota bacterium]|nr:hypothetical protein [Acidobacteriota bacterium]
MNRKIVLLSLIVLGLALGGCRSRTDKSAGPVVLSLNFRTLPVQVSVTTGPFQIDQVTVQSFSKDPTGTTSNLQNVELKSYQVRYRRHDTGTLVPPALVQSIFGLVNVNSTDQINNLPFLLTDQLQNPPLSDLAKFGADRETGSQVIVLDCDLQFFGQTLSGDNVATSVGSFTIEVRP